MFRLCQTSDTDQSSLSIIDTSITVILVGEEGFTDGGIAPCLTAASKVPLQLQRGRSSFKGAAPKIVITVIICFRLILNKIATCNDMSLVCLVIIESSLP